jgi:lysozyme
MDKARSLFLQYNKAGGSVVDGLVQRRLQEVAWFGQGGPTAQVANASFAAMASAASGAASSAATSEAPRGAMAVGIERPRTDTQASSGENSATQFSSLGNDQVLLSLLSHMANVGVGNDGGDWRKREHQPDQKSADQQIRAQTG